MRRFLAYSPIMLLLLLTSCVRDVVLDAGEKPTVVVECILSNNAPQELRLNFTKGAAQSEAEPLTEAVATLIDLTTDRTVGQFKKGTNDLWTLDYDAEKAHEYRLEIRVPGYDLIYAEDTMPFKVEVVERRRNERGGVEYVERETLPPLREVRHKFMDKYGISIFLRGSFYHVGEVRNTVLVYGMNYNPETGRHEIANEICSDHPSVLTYNITGNHYAPPCIAENYPKVLLYPILEGVPLHDRYLIFPKEALREEPYLIISGSFYGEWWNTDRIYDEDYSRPPFPDEGYLVFTSISDVYERYINDAIRLQQMKESTDMTTLYLMNNMYSNVIGGVGIFATRWEEKVQWNKMYTNVAAWERLWERVLPKLDPDEIPYYVGKDEYTELKELFELGLLDPKYY